MGAIDRSIFLDPQALPVKGVRRGGLRQFPSRSEILGAHHERRLKRVYNMILRKVLGIGSPRSGTMISEPVEK
jgi:hypothetical protein